MTHAQRNQTHARHCTHATQVTIEFDTFAADMGREYDSFAPAIEHDSFAPAIEHDSFDALPPSTPSRGSVEVCPECDGDGRVNDDSQRRVVLKICPVCNGSGAVRE